MISIYCGNDKTFIFERINASGETITTRPQKIWFSVKGKIENMGFIFQKTMDNGIIQREDGCWEVSIDADDTATVLPGKYVCDVKIIDEQGEARTIVKPQDFVVLAVVTN